MFGIVVTRGIAQSDKINIGAIQTDITNINNIIRKNANLDNSLIGQFTTFEDFIIPVLGTVLWGKLTIQTDGKDTCIFGEADNLTGTNFKELINSKILSPVMNEVQNIEFLFTISKGKVPLIQNSKNIMLGFCIIEGVSYNTTGVQAKFIP